ncbi:MAG: hypothetical protein ACRC0L_02320 [Angustibacter sp.]
MTMIQELRKTVADRTPVYALVGATDVLVDRARKIGAAAGEHVLEKVHQVRREAGQKSLQAMAQQLPSRAVDSGLHFVARAEETYEDLAERGAKVLSRRREPEAEQVTPAEPPARRAPVVVDVPSPAKPSSAKPSSAKPSTAPKARKAAAKPRVSKATKPEPQPPVPPAAH